ncbi:MAG: aspartyl protease family protein [Acidobacteriota bacterium]
MKAMLFIASGALAVMVWAASIVGAAHFTAHLNASPVAGNVRHTSVCRSNDKLMRLGHQTGAQPFPARFRVEKDRGLLLQVWINETGPYVFVLDTGAGMNVISQRVVTGSRLPTKVVPATYVGGLSSAQIASNREAIINEISIGERGNTLPTNQTALIVSNLPPDIDGILDPTQAYPPYGYSIDMPNERIEALDVTGLGSPNKAGAEGAVVAWVHQSGDTRPFVRLGDGRLALVDTGSSFGLAVNQRNAVIVRNNRGDANTGAGRDIAGGLIRSRRVSPSTISIGELVLRRIPTDILFGVHEDAPLILGRDALYPFKISFDPRRRLIEFVTSSQNSE